MLNILSILKYVRDGIMAKDDRYTVVGDEHIIDTKTGVKMHLYDDWLKMTHDDKTVIKMSDFTPEEQEVLWSIKEAITDPHKASLKREQYPELLKERRRKFSYLYENPIPMIMKSPIEEEGTEEYSG